MAMSFNTLVAPKGAAGSLLNWVGYSKVDITTVVDELQALIYSMLRVREMRTQWVFGLPVGGCKIALPPRFLDPVGRLTDNFGSAYRHTTEASVTDRRMYDTSPGGTLGNNPFTTDAVGSTLINVSLPAHALNQGADITFGTVPDNQFAALSNGTFLVDAIVDVNNLTIDDVNNPVSTSGINGGGSGITWTANNLIATSPSQWAVWNEFLQFDGAFTTATQFRLMCFKSLPLLSATNQTNFLTNRYPQLVREAGLASAAAFMKDDEEYTKHAGILGQMIQSANAESDLGYMGADLDTETP